MQPRPAGKSDMDSQATPLPRPAPPAPAINAGAHSHHLDPHMSVNQSKPSRHAWVWFLILLAIAAIAGYSFYPRIRQYISRSGTAPATQPKREVPVVAVPVRKGDLNLYLNGLGTVTPFNTVTIRPRVEGQIMKIGFHEGQIVKEGDTLIEIDPRPFEVQLTQAQGQYARDVAQLKGAEQDLKRYLEAGPSVAQQQIEQQRALVEQYEGVKKSDQGQIDNVKLQLTYCHITAPMTGRIGFRIVDVGNMVHANDSTGLAVITQLRPISVIFTIPQDSISRVGSKPDGGSGLTVEAWNRDLTKKIATGSLLAMDNQVDPTTGMLKLKASFPNEDNALFPSQFVNARLLVDVLQAVAIIPAAAVQRGPDSIFVYVVKPGDSTVELRKLRTGPTEAEQTVVEDGLKPGEVVVTDGVDKLQQGAKVAVRSQDAGARGGRGAATGPASRAATGPAASDGKGG